MIPCYNYGRYLEQCVDSVTSQKEVEVRALIIDDCSIDNTEEVGKMLAMKDKRVQFRRHEKNHGHIATYNEGLLDWAEADYVLLLSADDMLAPNALARAAHVLSGNHDIGFCYGRQIIFEEEPPKGNGCPGEQPAFEVMSGREFI